MATREELSQALRNADKAGDVEGAKRLAAYIKAMPAERAVAPGKPAKPDYDPSEGGSTLQILNPFGENFNTGINISESVNRGLAGAGKAYADTGRGLAQFFGADNTDDIRESRERDRPLMNTTAGKVGNFGGNVAITLPALAIPGAATLRGASLIGAGQGFIQPSLTAGETAFNTGFGALAGAGGIAVARGVSGIYNGAKALAEPFTQAGRQRIAGRTLERFADDASKVAATTAAPTATGARPTIAEQTGDAGLARLQDALRSLDPQIEGKIAGRLAENNAARVQSLQGLAGTQAEREAAQSARVAASKPAYDRAIPQAAAVDGELAALLKRPSVQMAAARAERIAAEQGRQFGLSGNKIRGDTLQDLKMGMDDLLKDPTSGIAGKEAGIVRDTRNEIVKWMEQRIPDFKEARTAYAEASKPLNAMDIGEKIVNSRALSNTSDLAGNQRMQANALLGLLRDEPKLIAQATGRKGMSGSLADILTPQQLSMLKTVASETDRAAAVATAGNGPGSATAQRMASQNVLRQLVGPTGLPASFAESAIANTAIGKPLNLIYGGVAEPKIQQQLAQAVLDPEVAKQVLAAARQLPPADRNALMRFLTESARVAPSSATVSGSNNNN